MNPPLPRVKAVKADFPEILYSVLSYQTLS